MTKSGFFERTISVEYNGKNFNVLEFQEQDKAAMLLSSVNDDIHKLKDHVSQKYKDSDNAFLNQISRRIVSTYSETSLKENYPDIPRKDVSFNLNKGETIAICLRNYNNPDVFHSYNEILFVALHELAHSINCDESSLMCGNSYGHDETFWSVFKVLLQNAVELDIYEKKDYRLKPVDYCSMRISYSPLYDKTLPDF
jgi:hypothetical protein